MCTCANRLELDIAALTLPPRVPDCQKRKERRKKYFFAKHMTERHSADSRNSAWLLSATRGLVGKRARRTREIVRERYVVPPRHKCFVPVQRTSTRLAYLCEQKLNTEAHRRRENRQTMKPLMFSVPGLWRAALVMAPALHPKMPAAPQGSGCCFWWSPENCSGTESRGK